MASAAVSGNRILFPSPAPAASPRRFPTPCRIPRPRPRPRPRLRLRLVACHSDTVLAAGAHVPQAPEVGPADDELASWLRAHGLPPCKVVLKERAVPCSRDGRHRPLRYVAAREDLEVGDVAFEVPISLVVTLERVLGDETVAELLTTNKLSELACLALYLMYEKKQGIDSFWYPFIKELDRQRGRGQLAAESPLLWSESELDYLNGSPVKAEVLAREEGIMREYKELDTLWFMAGSLFQQYPFDIPTEAFPFEIFKQAFVAVQSCVIHLQKVSLARRFALVPLGPPLLTYKSNSKAIPTAVGNSVQLVVDRPYKAGEPIMVWYYICFSNFVFPHFTWYARIHRNCLLVGYAHIIFQHQCKYLKVCKLYRCGPQTNSKLLVNYGFVDEDNPYDRLVIEASLNTEDPQFQEKRMVAQRNGKLAIQNFHAYVGKEKEALLEMLPYLRLGYISDPEEMQSVISSEGATCPVSPCTERAVLDQLVEYFKSRLAGYPTTLDEDEAMLTDSNLEPKKEVATRLLRLEKKMLHTCLQVTNELISNLPDHTVSPCPATFAPELK